MVATRGQRMGQVPNAFPLAAFLVSLQGIGARVDARRLRAHRPRAAHRRRLDSRAVAGGAGVPALPGSPAWQPTFERRFDEFFDPVRGQWRSDQTWSGCRPSCGSWRRRPPAGFSEGPATPRLNHGGIRPVPLGFLRLWSRIRAAILIIMGPAGGYAAYRYFKPDPSPGRGPVTPLPAAPAAPTAPPPPPRIEEDRHRLLTSYIPAIDIVAEATDFEPVKWQPAAWGAGLLLLAALVYGAWLRYYCRPPEDPAPVWNEQLPQWFIWARSAANTRRVRTGDPGSPGRWAGYFQSEQSGERLDVPAHRHPRTRCIRAAVPGPQAPPPGSGTRALTPRR